MKENTRQHLIRTDIMTNFLPAGIINENLDEIVEKIDRLRELGQDCSLEVQQELQVLKEMTLELRLFMSSFSCQPLIYTGPGSTEEIIQRLEWALAFSEEVDSMELLKWQIKTKSKASPK